MKLRTWLALVVTLLAVSACIIEPIGGRGQYDEGRRVWR